MGAIGRFFGLLCFVGGHFGPMYAAGLLEAANVRQYEAAERSAAMLGLDVYVACLRAMVVEETRHEVFFGDQVRGHVLLPLARRSWAGGRRDRAAGSRYVCIRCGATHEPDAVRWRCDCGGWLDLAPAGTGPTRSRSTSARAPRRSSP